jgi:hypothetical protein
MWWAGGTVRLVMQFVAAADFIRAEATEPLRTYVRIHVRAASAHIASYMLVFISIV